MNDHEQRQEERRRRYLELAEKAEAESNSQYDASNRAVEHIPLGQPILIGHHSEKRHRRDLERCHRAMDRSVEARKKAEYYRQKARGVGRAGISSDDPDALEKLREKIDRLEKKQEAMKDLNARHRRGHLTPEESAAFARLKGDTTYITRPVESWQLSNNLANIKRLKKRLQDLEAADEAVDVEEEREGYTYREDTRENRVMFEFPGKPEESVRSILKGHGFRWSPSRVAWVRQLNNAGRYAGEMVKKQLEERQSQ